MNRKPKLDPGNLVPWSIGNHGCVGSITAIALDEWNFYRHFKFLSSKPGIKVVEYCGKCMEAFRYWNPGSVASTQLRGKTIDRHLVGNSPSVVSKF